MKKLIILIPVLFFSINNNAYSQAATSLTINDTRNTNELPNFHNLSIKADFKSRAAIGVPGSGTYSANLTFSPWVSSDNTGGKNHQLNLNEGGLFYRNAYPLDSQWGNWQKILMANSNGNVGIGVENPSAKLEVLSSLETNGNEIITSLKRLGTATGGSSIVRFGYHSTCDFEVNSGYSSEAHRFGGYFDLNITNNHTGGVHGGINFATNASVKMAINANGNVGIGTFNPLFKLDVNGILNVTSENNGGGLRFNSAVNGFADSRNWFVSTDGYAYGDFVIKSSSTINGTPDQIKLLIKSNGNLGLGTATPDEKLTVKGKIHTQEVRVDMLGPLVPDYVFANDYELKSLEEVEDYIKQNSHLPEIPSAKEIEKNGLMLAEMNMSLLKKIEELTLYSIEQNKKIETQAKEIESLKDLVLRVTKLESEIARK